jgi:segregation and condensation protein A
MEYRVELESFRGPLDLLLYLVKRNEVDILDIPIARITEQFQEYLSLIQLIDMEGAGDFLVMAATLLEIKARMLLPRSEDGDVESDDPRRELVRQLLEYKRFKDAASLLEIQAQRQMTRLSRQAPPVPVDGSAAPPPLRRVELWDLVSAFGRLLRETTALQPRQIVVDETPVHVFMEGILQRLQDQPCLSLRQLFEPPYTRGRLLGLFLAILELIKAGSIQAEQPDPFGDMWIGLVQPERGVD